MNYHQLFPSSSTARLACVLGLAVALPATAAPDRISLAGPWRFALDRKDAGIQERWFERTLPDQLTLPGSLQEQGFGDDISVDTPWTGSIKDRSWFTAERYAPYRQPGHVRVPFWLQPDKYYVGAAWYQREVRLPQAWRGRRVVLRLERAHWGTTLWVDGARVGQQDGLCVPHEYDLGVGLSPGQHRLTLRVDNRVLVPVGVDAHSVTDHTQGNWNGLAGDLSLSVSEPVWLDNVQVFPDVAARTARVRVEIGNQSGKAGAGTLKISARSCNTAKEHRAPPMELPVHWSAEGGRAEFDYPLGAEARLWDEFNPALYRLTLEVAGVTAPRTVTFGLREVAVAGKQIAVNGRRIYLRGTLECCIFPQHGYPPTDVGSWKRVLRVARAHGLNHLRFHSWCPPEAAFVAADELGFYYQVECSTWSFQFNQGTALDTWIYAESERIVKAHGNHPSFLLMVPSNEPGGRDSASFLGKFVAYWKAKDARRLYTAGSGWPAVPENQYHVTPGARAFPVHARLGETSNDYSGFLAKQTVPIVSHEIGQYCVFPDLDEIWRYKGLLKAKNFEIVGDFLAQAGLGGQAREFLRASGRLQALFYKDEIEACMRTPGWGGFALLDLHDFPGQGTALVGVLNAFWEEKGYIKPRDYRRFCDQTVPLARLPKRIWTSDETFRATIDVAHFGAIDLGNAVATWQVRNAAGRTVVRGQLPARTLPTGNVTSLGQVEFPLAQFPKAAALNLEVALAGTRFANDWNFWVYPSRTDASARPGVMVTNKYDAAAINALQAGGRVVLLADPRAFRSQTVGRFDPIFWNRLWFPSQPQHTLGLLMDPKHPALAGFPTTFHADWQWQDLQNHSHPVVLDQLPRDLHPIVQVIDDWNSCRKLGLVFEANVANGRLLVCAVDLNQDLEERPAARQLRASLLDYAAGDRFRPKTRLEVAQVQALFRDLTAMEKLGARLVSCDSAQPGYGAELILDADPNTLWHTPWGDNAPGFPHQVVLGFERTATLSGVALLPRQDGLHNGWIKECEVYLSADGQHWGEPVARGMLSNDSREKELRFAQPATGKYLKVVALSSFDDSQPYASLGELTLLNPTAEEP